MIDNSSSMNKEQESIANQFDNFLATLSNMDYHIAIITTDPKQLGNFVPFPNGSLWLSNPSKSGSVHSGNVRYFQRTVRRPVGGYPEEGIASLNRALEKKDQSDFFRPHSLLVAIIVSDDDEAGGPKHGKYHKTWDNKPTTFFQKVSDLYPYSLVTVHSIIFKPGDSKSDCPNGDAPGHVYASASHPSQAVMNDYGHILRGYIGSICAPNYSSQLGPIAANMRKRVFPLPCHPIHSRPTLVKVNGRSANFNVQGRKVFIEDRVPFGAETEVSFYCKVEN